MSNKPWIVLSVALLLVMVAAPAAVASHDRPGTIVFSHDPDDDLQIYKVELPEREVHQLTGTLFGEGTNADPRFSPDGSRVAFASDRDGDWDLYSMAPDGSDVAHLLDRTGDQWSPTWSPDGSRIAFIEKGRERYAIHMMRADGTYVKKLRTKGLDVGGGLDWAPCKAVLFNAQTGPRDYPGSYTIRPWNGRVRTIGVGSGDMRWNRQGCRRIIFSSSKGPPESTSLYTMNRYGEKRGLVRTEHAKSYDHYHGRPAWSHDGRLAYDYMDHGCFYCNELRVYDPATGEDHTVLEASEVWFWDIDWQP